MSYRKIEGRTVFDVCNLSHDKSAINLPHSFPPMAANDVFVAKRVYRNDEPFKITDWKGVQTGELGIILVFLEERLRGSQRLIFSNVSVSQSWNNWVFDGGQGDDRINFVEERLYARGFYPTNLIAAFDVGNVNRICSRSPVPLTPSGGPGSSGYPATWNGVSILEDADDRADLHITHSDPDGPCHWVETN